MADNSEVLRIHNDPKLTTGEKMRKIKALVGGDFTPGRASYEELTGRKATGGVGVRGSTAGNFYTARRP